jgi:DNA-binding CsgD family transcriptional regulator
VGGREEEEPMWNRLIKGVRPLTPALGAGMYWAGVIFILLPRGTENATPLRQVLTSALIVLLILVAVINHERFKKHRAQKALALAAIVADLGEIALRCIGIFHDYSVLAGVQWGLDLLSSAFLTLFWGMFFAAYDKKLAERATLNTSLFCFAFFACLLCLPYEAAFWAALVMKAVSTLPFLLKNEALTITDRSVRKEAQGIAMVFFSVRAFVGACIGAIMCLITFVSPLLLSQKSPLLSIACCVIAGVLVVFIKKKKDIECMPLLTTMPLMLFFGLIVLHAGSHGSLYEVLQVVALPTLWLSWTMLSSVQNSEMKEAIGMSEALLSFLEKGVKNLFLVIGFLVAYVFVMSVGPETVASFLGQFAVTAVVVWLILVTYFLVRLSNVKERGKALESSPTVEKEIEEICRSIARDYGLSQREEEILELLARGHAQPYICEHFVLAPGTVKSHVTHIYRKLNIGKRESLFTVINIYRSELAKEKQYR